MSNALKKYLTIKDHLCGCGKVHRTSLNQFFVEAGAIERLPLLVASYNVNHPFLLADRNTWQAAGEKAAKILGDAGYKCSRYIFPQEHLDPDEYAVGSAVMHYDHECDIIIAIGSGVINDIGKILAALVKCPYFIIGTAPSMDGYNSATSSMERDGRKVSLATRCPDIIIGDLDVLCRAPERMLWAGLGDMLAKYVSICEWRIAALLLGEPYCEAIADLVRSSLSLCVEQARGAMRREQQAVAAMFEGLVVCGAAMEFAGISRPASGVEHYISHIWDMRGLAFGTPTSLHGIQCAIGTLQSLRAYDRIRQIRPDREKALAAVNAFEWEEWCARLREFLGRGAEVMIADEAISGKYEKQRHALRLEKIISNWDSICTIMDEELPPIDMVQQVLEEIEAPKEPEDIGIDRSLMPMTFMASKDIRDKYVLPRLAWDLGLLDELAQSLL